MKLGVEHCWLKYYNVCINHDPVLTLIQLMARSTWVTQAFEWGNLLNVIKREKPAGNWQMDRILIILNKENGPRESSAPALGVNTIIFKHVYWYLQRFQGNVYKTIGPLVQGVV